MMKPIYIFMQMMHKDVFSKADHDQLKMSLSKLHDWSNTWLLSLNAQKCKVVSYGRQADKNYKYKMIQQYRIIELDCEYHIKDLGF